MIDVCPYCDGPVSLVDSNVVYGKSYGMIYLCDNYPKCDAYVGVHSNSKKHAPLGRLANPDLRRLKRQVHGWFDPLWRYKSSKTQDVDVRKNAYGWLAKKLGIKAYQCHIGMFDEEICQRAIDICRVIYHDKPRLDKFRQELIKKGEI